MGFQEERVGGMGGEVSCEGVLYKCHCAEVGYRGREDVMVDSAI